MSTVAFVEGKNGSWAAWETDGQVSFGPLNPDGAKGSLFSPPGNADNPKHPAIAVNDRGETLLAWAEDTGWEKGGALAWQVFDRAGKPTNRKGKVAGGIPVWGIPTAAAKPDGGFVIIR